MTDGRARGSAAAKRQRLGLVQSTVDLSNAEAWARLFDLGEVDAACAALAEAATLPGEGGCGAADSLAQHFLGPLRLFLDASQGQGGSTAQELGEALYMRGHMLAMVFGHGSKPTAGDLAAFRSAWVEFVAAAAGAVVYHDWPAQQAQRGKAARAARGDARVLTPEVLAEWLRRRGQDRVITGRGGNLDLICAEFKVGDATVWRRLREARAAGLLHISRGTS